MDERFTPPYPKPYKNKWKLLFVLPFNLGSWIHVLLEKAYTMKLARIKTPKINFWVVNDKPLIKQIMEKEPDNFPKHQMLHEMLEPLLGESIFTTNGEKWKNQRKMMNPSFTHTNLRRVFGTMNGAVNVLLQNIDEHDLSKPVEVDPLMTHVTADIIFRTILSKELSKSEAKEVLDSFNEFQKHTQISTVSKLLKLPRFYSDRKISKSTTRIKNIFSPIIKARHENYHSKKRRQYNDVMQTLLAAKHPKTGEGFGFEELVDQMGILFLAGHETSATALTWTLYLISKCPHMQEQMLEEINKHSVDGIIEFESLKNLNLTKNIFMESLRLYPPVSFYPREVAEDQVCMRGKIIEKGAPVVVSSWLVHRSPNHWQDPNSFCPARFDDESQKESVKESFIPFGKGQRVCVGAGFAYQEAILVLANIVRKYKLSNPEGQVPEPVSRVTTRPKNGIKLIFTPR